MIVCLSYIYSFGQQMSLTFLFFYFNFQLLKSPELDTFVYCHTLIFQKTKLARAPPRVLFHDLLPILSRLQPRQPLLASVDV